MHDIDGDYFSLVNYALFTDNTRTIHALFTHYSYHFRGGAVGVTAQNSKL